MQPSAVIILGLSILVYATAVGEVRLASHRQWLTLLGAVTVAAGTTWSFG